MIAWESAGADMGTGEESVANRLQHDPNELGSVLADVAFRRPATTCWLNLGSPTSATSPSSKAASIGHSSSHTLSSPISDA